MDNKHIRFKQRFQNFEKAFLQLTAAVEQVSELDDLSKEGLIQRFEYTFELAWKCLKDFLESKNVETRFPRDVLKESFKAGIIDQGEIWLEMLEQRNILAHTYDEENFKFAIRVVTQSYYQQISQLYITLKNE